MSKLFLLTLLLGCTMLEIHFDIQKFTQHAQYKKILKHKLGSTEFAIHKCLSRVFEKLNKERERMINTNKIIYKFNHLKIMI